MIFLEKIFLFQTFVVFPDVFKTLICIHYHIIIVCNFVFCKIWVKNTEKMLEKCT